MASSLSNLVNNLFEGIHRITCKFGYNDKKYKSCRIKYKCCDIFLKYRNFNDDVINKNVFVAKKLSTEARWKIKGRLF